MKRTLRRVALAPLRLTLQAAGRVYVPGADLEDALRVGRRFAQPGASCTLGYFHPPDEHPAHVADIDRRIVDAMASLEPPGYVSIKAPALGYDPALVTHIVADAMRAGMLAHFDSHEHHTAEPTLACVRQAVAAGARVGLTLPGRWRRSPDDAAEVAALGIRARVVKGEWGDPGDPGHDARRGFLDVIAQLAGRSAEVAVATHDPGLAGEAIGRLQAAGTACTLELLHGLPRREMLALAKARAVPVCLYVPFGIAWRPYALRKAAANPRILAWVVRDAVCGALATVRRRG